MQFCNYIDNSGPDGLHAQAWIRLQVIRLTADSRRPPLAAFAFPLGNSHIAAVFSPRRETINCLTSVPRFYK